MESIPSYEPTTTIHILHRPVKEVVPLILAATLIEDNRNHLYADPSALLDGSMRKTRSGDLCWSPTINNSKKALITGNKYLQCGKEICMPTTLLEVEQGTCKLWITNYSQQPQLITKGMNIGTLTNLEENTICFLNDVNPAKYIKNQQSRKRNAREKLRKLLDAELTSDEKEYLLHLLEDFGDIFDFNRASKNHGNTTVKHKINTGDSLPIKHRPYRVSAAERAVIKTEVQKMLKEDVINSSESPWSSPVVLVKKKNGEWRFCVDYRRLNKVTKKDLYPLPRIDDALDYLAGARIFSMMDLKSGYWQVELDDKDREKTAFVTPDGLFEFKVMPFGLFNAPATFERMMDSVLRGLKWNICLCYLDDIIVFAPNFQEHQVRLRKVLTCIQEAGLSLNSSKCCFGKKKLLILGHLVDEHGIYLDPEKVAAVEKFPIPQNIAGVRSFLGISSYYRRFIKSFANVARQLQELLKKDAKFAWKSPQKHSFATLKKSLIGHPVFLHFQPEADTLIHSDASGYGIDAVLVQMHDGQEKPIAYASRSLTPAEKNYSTTEEECLAVIWAISKFRPYLFGKPFTVVTDHHSLCWLANVKDPTGRLARWALRLQEYDITIVYKSGRKHSDADSLSRNPLISTSVETCDEIPTLASVTEYIKEQLKDPKLKSIIKVLKRGDEYQNYLLKDGVLYKKTFDPMGQKWLLVVPKQLRGYILRSLHDAPTAGHLGFAKTYDHIRRKYYLPGLYGSTRRYISLCKECQRRKTPPQLPPGQLQPIEPPDIPFAKVGIDLLGRFPVTRNGNRWIIVCTDYLTSFTVTKALPTGEAIEVAKFIVEEIILKHGSPKEMISDRGRTFLSNLVKTINQLCQTSHLLTTAYHPQTNGLTESFNKTLADMLSMYTDVEQKNWDTVLPFVTFAYNSAKQNSTGFSPFFLIYGRNITTPLDVILPHNNDQDHDDSYVQQLITRFEEARQLAKIHIKDAQASDKRRYYARHRSVSYEIGDLVWVYTPIRKVGLSEKLLRRYFGPYRITCQMSEVTYEVESMETYKKRRKLKNVVHVLRIKPYYEPKKQLGEEQHVVVSRRPVTRSQTRQQRDAVL
ncbi:Transposon Ty3-I Gag-Pol polyprotein [Araneus ventricosus]|uniref:RNA-directed DNA polymerase n=1 Tax=Araneus ventricosus TaxID=182803 RepID=A0A4Y2ERS5_ARAVE|nr:Transposon Ty3-I Gag-Pol polyprotein [Araneus ventricosus]